MPACSRSSPMVNACFCELFLSKYMYIPLALSPYLSISMTEMAKIMAKEWLQLMLFPFLENRIKKPGFCLCELPWGWGK